MYVHRIPLEARPQGTGIGAAEADMPFSSNVTPGATVTLRFREIRIIAQILELEEDMFYVGQVIDFDGTLEPEVQGVNIGSYLRFREEHIFSCHRS